MEDNRTIQEIMRELSNIERNNQSIENSITSIDLLQVSNENGTVKDAEISKKLAYLKEKVQAVSEASNQLSSMLRQQR